MCIKKLCVQLLNIKKNNNKYIEGYACIEGGQTRSISSAGLKTKAVQAGILGCNFSQLGWHVQEAGKLMIFLF